MNARRLVLAILCTMTGALVSSAAPALAATGNAYRSQSTGSGTAAGGFYYPSGLAVNASGDVYVNDAGDGVIDEFDSSGSGAPLMEITPSEIPNGSFAGAAAIAVNGSGDLFTTCLLYTSPSPRDRQR